MNAAAEEMKKILLTIPNVPYPEVPEGKDSNDNVVEKMGGTEKPLPKDPLPHWELAKKYKLIDFDLGVKISGAGFPVYTGKGARLQRALINFFLDEATKAGYREVQPHSGERRFRIRHRTTPRQRRTNVSLRNG